jgi:Fic family protein
MSKILAQVRKAAKRIEAARQAIRDVKEELLLEIDAGKPLNSEALREIHGILVQDKIWAPQLAQDFRDIVEIARQRERA